MPRLLQRRTQAGAPAEVGGWRLVSGRRVAIRIELLKEDHFPCRSIRDATSLPETSLQPPTSSLLSRSATPPSRRGGIGGRRGTTRRAGAARAPPARCRAGRPCRGRE